MELVRTIEYQYKVYCFCCSDIIPIEEIRQPSPHRVLGYCIYCSARGCYKLCPKRGKMINNSKRVE